MPHRGALRAFGLMAAYLAFCHAKATVAWNLNAHAKSSTSIRASTIPVDFAVQIDAGSTGSRVFIYAWERRESVFSAGSIEHSMTTPTQVDWSIQTKPGLSKFGTAAAAGASLVPLLDFAKERLGKAGCPAIASVPLFLGATAGMRVLHPDDVTAILNSVRRTVRAAGFLLRRDEDVRVLSGEEEGVFGWIAVNWLSKTYAADTSTGSLGALDLGGASTQITFRPTESILDGYFPLTINDRTTDLYTHSYLYYGRDEALELQAAALLLAGKHSNPCFPVGANDTSVYRLPGSADSAACAQSVDTLIDVSVPCMHADRTRCSFLGVFQPKLPRELHFVAMSYFYYLWSFFGLGQTANLASLQAKAAETCAMSLAELRYAHPTERDEYLTGYCFGGWYVLKLLHKGYGFELEHTNLSVAESIDGTALSWTFGAMLYSANKMRWALQRSDQPCISPVLFWGTSAALAAVIGTLLFMLLRQHRLKAAISDRGYVIHVERE